MASSVNGQGHTGIQLGRGSTLGLADVRVERGQVSLGSCILGGASHVAGLFTNIPTLEERNLAQRPSTGLVQEHLLLPEHHRTAHHRR